MRDHGTGARQERLRRGGDRDGALRAAKGGLDRGEAEQRLAGSARAADALVGEYGAPERLGRRARVGGGEGRPPHLAVHASDLREIADGFEHRERFAVERGRPPGVALGERHLGEEALRHPAAFVVADPLLDASRVLHQRHAGLALPRREEQHALHAHRQRLDEGVDRCGAPGRVVERLGRGVDPPEAQVAVAHAHPALGRDPRVPQGFAVLEAAGPLAERALPLVGRGRDHAGPEPRERAAPARRPIGGERQQGVVGHARGLVLAADVPEPVLVAAQQERPLQRLAVAGARARGEPARSPRARWRRRGGRAAWPRSGPGCGGRRRLARANATK